MARTLPYYPPGPRNVPDDFTEPGESYKTRVVLVLFSLIAFFGLYAGSLFVSILLCGLSVIFAPVVLKAPLALFFGLCFVFLVKPFFRRPPKERNFWAEIDSTEHPRLHAFLKQLCRETGADFPHRIYLGWEVNACVFYDDDLRCLFLPTPKNLQIGLGLLNVLNLSEFKAVLAHEFGHFTQKSMRVGSYVYIANRFMIDLVAGRDWLDDLVLRLRRYRNVVGALASVCWGIFWLFRQVLTGCFYGINFLGRALSREKEFHADRVAVSVAGSDAIVHGLYRLEFAGQALGQAGRELQIASQHELYTNDLFYHQTRAADYLRRVRDDPTLGDPPPVPDGKGPPDDLFTEEEHGVTSKWDSHPSMHDREQSVKEVYLRAAVDERSPWLLFDDAGAVRERVTRRFYRCAYGLGRDDADFEPAERVQAFIDAEHAETTYDKRYQGAYDGRFIDPGATEALEGEVQRDPWKPEILSRNYQRLFGPEFRERTREYLLLYKEREILKRVQNDARQGKVESFLFRDRSYRPASVKRLTKKVEDQYREELRWLAARDRMVYLIHYQMAREVGRATANELASRYRFHLKLQQILCNLIAQQTSLQLVLAVLNNTRPPLAQSVFQDVRERLRKAHEILELCLRTAFQLRLPRLENMTEGAPLSGFLLPRTLIKGLRPTASVLTVKWINKFLRQMSEVREKVRRIHFKSLGAILRSRNRSPRSGRRSWPTRPKWWRRRRTC